MASDIWHSSPVHGSAPRTRRGGSGSRRAGAAGVALAWKAPRGGTEPEAYLVFRDGRRIARTKRRVYVDRHAKPGRHRYEVVAVDAKGRRSRRSPIVRARVPAQAPLPPRPPAPIRRRSRRPTSAAS